MATVPASSSSASVSLDLTRVRQVCVKAVIDACKLCTETQARLVKDDVAQKKDRSPVTIADFGSQAVISHMLGEAFPDIPLVGEEDAEKLRNDADMCAKVMASVNAVRHDLSKDQVLNAIDRGLHGGGDGTFWVLDPIDGTKGFLRREQYAVCLALIDRGRVLVTVLGCPNLPCDDSRDDATCERGCLFIAVDGQGATQLDIASGVERPIKVSGERCNENILTVESVESGHAKHGFQARLTSMLGITRAPVRMDSQTKFCVVARGQASLYLRFAPEPDYNQQIWDIAPGAKLIEEAGGRVSDGLGNPLVYTRGRGMGTGSIFASNGFFHDQVLEVIKVALREEAEAAKAEAA